MPASTGGLISKVLITDTLTSTDGMTRRGLYAAFAMNGLISDGFRHKTNDYRRNEFTDHDQTEELVKRAFVIADCMISHEDST